MKSLDIIVFSKDRPFQLNEYLLSIKAHLLGTKQIYVIWKSKFKNSYQKLAIAHPDVTFIEEVFINEQVEELLGNSKADYLMFGVDDVYYYNDFELDEAFELLESGLVFSYHLRLNQNITYSFSLGKLDCCPFSLPINRCSRIYHRNQAFKNSEWNYPFELTSAIYRMDAIRAFYNRYLLDEHHPNLIEAHGNGTIRKFIEENKSSLFSAYPKSPVCSIITINVVQDIFPNNVGFGPSLEELDQYYLTGYHFDKAYYKNTVFKSPHITDFKIIN